MTLHENKETTHCSYNDKAFNTSDAQISKETNKRAITQTIRILLYEWPGGHYNMFKLGGKGTVLVYKWIIFSAERN